VIQEEKSNRGSNIRVKEGKDSEYELNSNFVGWVQKKACFVGTYKYQDYWKHHVLVIGGGGC
jgi:hypothetical protein